MEDTVECTEQLNYSLTCSRVKLQVPGCIAVRDGQDTLRNMLLQDTIIGKFSVLLQDTRYFEKSI